MCRIVGIIDFTKKLDLENLTTRMRDSMAHGGPDDAGLYVDHENALALGHRRLSIIDPSPLGHQPMCSQNRNIWITYNGEVYNFLDIRKELQSRGHVFSSHSDTEVILKAYEEWGEQAFEKFNGMFAFCIYDKRNDLLYLVRDHAGIKPLYYSISNQQVIFSSEVRAFKIFNPAWEENQDWRIYFLVFGHIPEPYTTLKNVFTLPKQSFLKWNLKNGKKEIKKYTDSPFTPLEMPRAETLGKIKDSYTFSHGAFIPLENFLTGFTREITSLDDALKQINNTFSNAVERHLISDAPIGVFLSGGIDSSLITLLAHKYQKGDLNTLSVVFNEPEFSEEAFQNIVLSQTNSKHHSYLVSEKDFKDNIDDIFRAMDQPTIDGVNTYFISKCAKEDGLKSVLSGIGGDELFGGYPSFKWIQYFWRAKSLCTIFRKLFSLCEYIPTDKLKKLSFLSLPEPLSYYLMFRGLFTPKRVAGILNCSTNDVINALGKLDIKVDPSLDKTNLMTYLETELYMKNQLLKDTDVMSMWHSVELRVPFLDREFMNLVFSIDEELKFDQATTKHLITKAFKDTIPTEIVNRKKQGFTFPFDIWIRQQGRGPLDEVISKGNINKQPAERLWRKFESGSLHWSKMWGLMVMGNKS
jgi:asparagine synthase (glutamine-hydrolyzing)